MKIKKDYLPKTTEKGTACIIVDRKFVDSKTKIYGRTEHTTTQSVQNREGKHHTVSDKRIIERVHQRKAFVWHPTDKCEIGERTETHSKSKQKGWYKKAKAIHKK